MLRCNPIPSRIRLLLIPALAFAGLALPCSVASPQTVKAQGSTGSVGKPDRQPRGQAQPAPCRLEHAEFALDSNALKAELPNIQDRLLATLWTPLRQQTKQAATLLPDTPRLQVVPAPGAPYSPPDGTVQIPLPWLARASYAMHLRSLELTLKRPLGLAQLAPDESTEGSHSWRCITPTSAPTLPALTPFDRQVVELMDSFGTVAMLAWVLLQEAGHRVLAHPTDAARHTDPTLVLAADAWAFAQMDALQVPFWPVEAHFKAEATWQQATGHNALWQQRLELLQRHSQHARQHRRMLSYAAAVPFDQEDPNASPAVFFFVLNNLRNWPNCSSLFVEVSSRRPHPIATAMEAGPSNQRILRRIRNPTQPGSTSEFHFADVSLTTTQLAYGQGETKRGRHRFTARNTVPAWPIIPHTPAPPEPRALLLELLQTLQLTTAQQQRTVRTVRQSEQAQCNVLNRFVRGDLTAEQHRSHLEKVEAQLHRKLKRVLPKRHAEVIEGLTTLMKRTKLDSGGAH